MDECKLVTDLLPTYCDGLTSPETTALVESHVASCPCCAAQLAKMRARQENDEQEKRREEFRRALPVYELNYKVKVLWIVLACAILVIGFFILRSFSMELALVTKGISLEHMQVVSSHVPVGEDDLEQLIYSRMKDDKPVLAFLRKNFLGLWYVSDMTIADPDKGYDTDYVMWSDFGWSFYGLDHETYATYHVVFIGKNAVKLIDFPQEELPQYSVAEVRQDNEYYMIHITTVAIMKQSYSYTWNVPQILEKYGFVVNTVQQDNKS